MCYKRIYLYKIQPVESYQLKRNCPGCGKKSIHVNTYHFRINANGSKLDIWLIYQCQVCKHTFNLSIFERVNYEKIPSKLYEKFIKNDRELALMYGLDRDLYVKNRVSISQKSFEYSLQNQGEINNKDDAGITLQQGDVIEIENPYRLKVRIEKMVAGILNIPRSQIKMLLHSGLLEAYCDNKENKIYVRRK